LADFLNTVQKIYPMKSFIRISLLFLLTFAGIQASTQKASAQTYVSFQVFYDNLSPYGDWIFTPTYGYVWIPNAGPGFAPYGTNGYWVYTEYGWTWVSNYPWGWAPFHYGRWYVDPFYGPIWVPGHVWGPGWVTWRHCDGYYGWAPIEPGIEINIAYSNTYYGPRDQWRFVPDRDFGRRDIHKYYVNTERGQELMQKSSAINNPRTDNTSNTPYNAGPDRGEVQKVTGTKFIPVHVREDSKPGERMNKDELQIYRPRVEQAKEGSPKPVPSRITDLKDVKPVNEREPVGRKEEPTRQQPVKAEPQVKPNDKSNQISPAPRHDEPVKTKPAAPVAPKQQPSKAQPAPVPQKEKAVPSSPKQERPQTRPSQHSTPMQKDVRPTKGTNPTPPHPVAVPKQPSPRPEKK
jgi:hypothetical protein